MWIGFFLVVFNMVILRKKSPICEKELEEIKRVQEFMDMKNQAWQLTNNPK